MKKLIFCLMLVASTCLADGIIIPQAALPLSVLNGGTGVTTSTGSGSVVLGTSPTVTTTLTLSTNVAESLIMNRGNTSETGIQFGTGVNGITNFYGTDGASGYFRWFVGSERMRLSSNFLGVGYAADQGGAQKLQVNGNVFSSGISFKAANPTISSCGTSPSVDANSSNNAGTVTVGTVSATSCTITFANAYGTYNHCRVTSQSSVAAFAYSYTLSAITVTATSMVSDKLDYACDGV